MPELQGALADRVHGARAVVFDMDGTLVLGDSSNAGHRPLPGAVELLALLRRRGIPFRIFTNGTAKVPAVYAGILRHAGLDVHDEEMMTPSSVAADWFRRRRIRRIRVLGLDGVQGPLREAGLEIVGPAEPAAGVEAVFTGWFREFTFPDLEAACRDVWAGAILTTASNVPFFATQGGRAIGASFAINAMLRAMTGRRARVLGKPSGTALRCAVRMMGLPGVACAHTVVIGDDPALEMRMARSAGALALAVTTGLSSRDDFTRAGAAAAPNAVLDGLGPLVALFS
ncbi:MAG: haloacid dehalogenase [Gammaproteobacteria bacterium]|nr:MAG: haloacid dehalogenase [Gammaproteobacteria bacterium]